MKYLLNPTYKIMKYLLKALFLSFFLIIWFMVSLIWLILTTFWDFKIRRNFAEFIESNTWDLKDLYK